MSVSQQFILPDTLHSWPWQRKLNPNYKKVKAESSAWIESFHAFTPQAQDAFNRCEFSLLASLAFPNVSAEHLRTCCDFINLTFVYDEYSDACNAQEARRLANIVMDALRNPDLPRPQNESILGEITKQFWQLAKKPSSVDSAQNLFIETFNDYTTSIVEQAVDRAAHHINDIETYLRVRRNSLGLRPCLVLLHLYSELPEGFLSNPLIEYITTLTIDMVAIGNDICSYNIEQARGDGHNMITTVMNSMCFDLDEALLWISDLHDSLGESFQETYRAICQELPVSETSAAACLEGLGNWVRANDCWSYESERYFGQKGAIIRESRIVELLPRARVEVH
ncbi:terpenoid synthase [Lentinula raphanica]|nr:terpenoid synthase [Lentinula raphanica]